MIFPSSIDLSDLDGSNGFAFNVFDNSYYTGTTIVSGAGDINGDGIDDIIIGADFVDRYRIFPSGRSYVVFGSTDVGSNGRIERSDLNGSNGFVFSGITNRYFYGYSVSSAGDINGDGIDDIIIATREVYSDGSAYVVFGSTNVGSDGFITNRELDGSNGFFVSGNSGYYANTGTSVSDAGDINGDGIDDIIIGGSYASPNGKIIAGESYVVFGNTDVVSKGINALFLNGIDAYDYSGTSVSNAGDVNGDGIDDIIIGAPSANPNGKTGAGESYLVFGSSDVGRNGTIELSDLNGSNGFVINGIDSGDSSGFSVSSAGDVNGDGIDDIIISAPFADPDGKTGAGESYVVFGSSDVGSNGTIELSNLNGSNGFILNGINREDRSGFSVSSAGDVNGDGIDDIIIGADRADPDGKTGAGESYVVFGSSDIGSNGTIELSNLNGSNGFILNGVNSGDRSGFSVSNAGDVNGDGIDDIIIGISSTSYTDYYADPGDSYVVFGKANQVNPENPNPIIGTNGADTLIGSNGDDTLTGRGGDDRLFGAAGNDKLSGGNGNDTLDGGDDNDTLIGGNGNDSLLGNAGKDKLRGNGGSDTLDGGDDDDTLIGGNGDDSLFGAAGNDVLKGNSGDDTLNGSNGDDSLFGAGGNDLLFGAAGNDSIRSGSGNDTLNGDDGDDSLFGGKGDDRIIGRDGNDTLTGGGGDDILIGGDDDDILFGAIGNDRLRGGNGNDILNGAGGDDTLTGGEGEDVFILRRNNGFDLIRDFDVRFDTFSLAGGLEFEDLSFSGNTIGVNDQIIATVNGVNTQSLSEDVFEQFVND